MPDPRLFHVALIAPWEAFLASGEACYRPGSLETEGFCHFSEAAELEETLRLHFTEAPAAALVEVDAASLSPLLRFEPSRDGKLFPHLYGPIPRESLRRWWRLERTPEDRLSLPALAREPASGHPGKDPADHPADHPDDHPEGRPLEGA